ncbi:MAG: capsule assembly Wzi family protein [Cytophagales bacterium]|nr:capsule assembly Wzi family protein [Cytophagales bacterium]
MMLQKQNIFRRILFIKRVIVTLGIISICFDDALSQILPVGYPAVNDILRRKQVMGEYTEKTSFTNFPIEYPALKSSMADTSYKMVYTPLKVAGVSFNLQSPTTWFEFHSNHPYPLSNGIILPAKGLSNVTSLGLSIRHRFFSIQLRPEIYQAQNLTYDGFPDTHFPVIWRRRYRFWNLIDNPEQHGVGEKKEITTGQSHAMFTYNDFVGAGISSENLWWGPGKRNSLLMTNNARGFSHLFLKTLKPIKTPIGHFEANAVVGLLNNSGYTPPDTARTFLIDIPLYVAKEDDKRYFNAITFSYQPKWIKGLTIGASRSFQLYYSFAKETKSYFPVLFNLFRKNDDGREEQNFDQLISGYARWFWTEGKTEIYFEFGRNDAAFNLRDVLNHPQHSRAYIFGISKIFPIKDDFLEINYEHTELSQTAGYLVRDARSWYLHKNIRHGYTNRGEVIGAPIGPGSDMDHMTISYIRGNNKVGVVFERLSHQLDFYHAAWDDIDDFRRFWNDYTFGIQGYWQFNNLILDGNILLIRSLNYQWEIEELNIGRFADGREETNLSFTIKAAYLF